MLGKIAGYIETIARNPLSTAFVSLAEAYRQMGLLDDALEVAERGVAALPEFPSGFIVLGRILGQRGSFEAANQAFAKAVQLDPSSLPALKGWAKVLGLMGQHDRARQVLERAASLHPQDSGIAAMLAALPGKGTLATGIDLPKSFASPVDPSPPVPTEEDAEPFATATLAEIYVQQGLLNKALKVYRDLIQSHPDNADLTSRYRQLCGEGVGEPEKPEQWAGTPAEAVVPEEVSPKLFAKNPASTALVNRLDRWLAAIQDRREHVR